MGSKLKMKAPKKNRVLECDNQMSQAFARAMQNSRKGKIKPITMASILVTTGRIQLTR